MLVANPGSGMARGGSLLSTAHSAHALCPVWYVHHVSTRYLCAAHVKPNDSLQQKKSKLASLPIKEAGLLRGGRFIPIHLDQLCAMVMHLALLETVCSSHHFAFHQRCLLAFWAAAQISPPMDARELHEGLRGVPGFGCHFYRFVLVRAAAAEGLTSGSICIDSLDDNQVSARAHVWGTPSTNLSSSKKACPHETEHSLHYPMLPVGVAQFLCCSRCMPKPRDGAAAAVRLGQRDYAGFRCMGGGTTCSHLIHCT